MQSIRCKAYAPASALPAHRHDEPSLCLVVSGRYEETQRGRAVAHGPGHLLYCAAGEPHSQRFAGEGARKLLLRPAPAALEFLQARGALEPGRHVAAPRLAALARELAAELDARDDCAAMVVEGLVLELLGLFGRGGDERGRAAWLQRVRDYLHEHQAGELALEGVAREVGRHPTHVAREFKRAFGVSVGGYLREIRVQRAERLLDGERASLAQIAIACGFCDQAHMSRVFRALRGTTPAARRRARRA